MAAQIDLVLKRLKETSAFSGIRRSDYRSYLSAEDLLAEARAVGEFRTPDFVIDKGLQFAYENIARWIIGDPDMRALNPETLIPERGDLTKGIYLAGRTGCGKTWAMEILGYLAKEHIIRLEMHGKFSSLDIYQARADEITAAFIESGDVSTFVRRPILLINDLGTEPAEVLYMGNRVDVVRQVIERRADNDGRLTLFTSNIPMNAEELRERYGDRVVSRLRQMCNYIAITGNDKRIR